VDKKNCWEHLKCGREPGGVKASELGICPAANDASSNGLNGGVNGGRICWGVTGTLCGGEIQGTHAQKNLSCLTCNFYSEVKNEEGADFQLMRPSQEYKTRS
jgi:hypothetical protein